MTEHAPEPLAQAEAAPLEGGRDRRLRAVGLRIERLLGEVEASAGPATWAKVEELVRALLELHGEGLARVLAMASNSSPEAPLERRLGDDELVASLLLLHGLHPSSALERIRCALDELSSGLGLRAGAVEIVEYADGAILRLRLRESLAECSSSTVEHALRRAVEEAAPEVARIEIEVPGERRPSVQLVQLRRKRREDKA